MNEQLECVATSNDEYSDRAVYRLPVPGGLIYFVESLSVVSGETRQMAVGCTFVPKQEEPAEIDEELEEIEEKPVSRMRIKAKR